MIGSILVGTLEPQDHRGAFGIGGGTDPGGYWDEVLHGPGDTATSPALLNWLAAIPLALPDDIDDLLEAVAPLHRPEAAAGDGGSAPGGRAGGDGPGSWRKAGGRSWAAGLRRTLRHRRGTPAAWRTPVEGAQASAAASEAERIALGGTGLSFGTVAALGQIAKAEAPEEAAVRRPLHMPEAETPAAGEAGPALGGGGGHDAAALLAATYGVQAMAVGTTIIPTAFTVLGGSAAAAGTLPMHVGLAQGSSLAGVAAMVGPVKAAASPSAPPELLTAMPWVALSRGEAAKGPGVARAAEQPHQPGQAPHPAEAAGGGSGQAVAPAVETPALPASRSSQQEAAATGFSTAARPEPVLASTAFRAEPLQPTRPALQEEHARSEPASWSVPQDRGAAVSNAFTLAGADLRTQGGGILDRDTADRVASVTEAPKADPGQPGKSGSATARSADLAAPGDPTPAVKTAVAPGKEAGPDGLGPVASGSGTGLLPSGTSSGRDGAAVDERAGSVPAAKGGVAAAGLPPAVQPVDPAKLHAGSPAIPGEKAATLPGSGGSGKTDALPLADQPAAPNGGPGTATGPSPAVQAPDPLKAAAGSPAALADKAVAAVPGSGPGTADGLLPVAGGGPASSDGGAAGLPVRPDGVPRADHAAAPDIASPGPAQVPPQAGQTASRETAVGAARPEAVLPPGTETPALPGAAASPHQPVDPKLAGRAAEPEEIPSAQPGIPPSKPSEAGAPALPDAALVAAKNGPVPQPPTENSASAPTPVRPGLPAELPAPGGNPTATLPDTRPSQLAQGDKPGPDHAPGAGDGALPVGQAKPLLAEDHGGGNRPEGIGGAPGIGPAVPEPGRQPEALAPKPADPSVETVQPQATDQAVLAGPDLPGKPSGVAGQAEHPGGSGVPPGRQDGPAVEVAAPPVAPVPELPLDKLLAIFDPAMAELVPGLNGGGLPAMPPPPAGLPGEAPPLLFGSPGPEGDLILL